MTPSSAHVNTETLNLPEQALAALFQAASRVGRPAQYGSNAERQAAHRARHAGAIKQVRFTGKTPAAIAKIALALDQSEAAVIDSAVKFAMANHNFLTLGLPFDGARDDQRTRTGKARRSTPVQVDDLIAAYGI